MINNFPFHIILPRQSNRFILKRNLEKHIKGSEFSVSRNRSFSHLQEQAFEFFIEEDISI